MENFNIFDILLTSGAIAAGVYYAINIILYVVSYGIHWIDDRDKKGSWWINDVVEKIFKPQVCRWVESKGSTYNKNLTAYTPRYWNYWKLDKNDNIVDVTSSYSNTKGDIFDTIVGYTLVIIPFFLFISPIIIYVSYLIWEFLAIVGTFISVMYLARMLRRQQKIFKIHTEDKNAHKQTEEE